MNGTSCFFIGHREATDKLLPTLRMVVERHILEFGVTEFFVGHYGGFDRLAAKAVRETKVNYPGIVLYLLLPYHPGERPVPLPSGFDGSFYPPGMERVPRRLAIVRANRYMVDHVAHLIAYVRHPGSNTSALVDHGEKREQRGLLHITRL